jgi:hypothetical protein
MQPVTEWKPMPRQGEDEATEARSHRSPNSVADALRERRSRFDECAASVSSSLSTGGELRFVACRLAADRVADVPTTSVGAAGVLSGLAAIGTGGIAGLGVTSEDCAVVGLLGGVSVRGLLWPGVASMPLPPAFSGAARPAHLELCMAGLPDRPDCVAFFNSDDISSSVAARGNAPRVMLIEVKTGAPPLPPSLYSWLEQERLNDPSGDRYVPVPARFQSRSEVSIAREAPPTLADFSAVFEFDGLSDR